MTNMKKIGLTALAASLVSTSAFAADFKIKGDAKLEVGQYSGVYNAGKTFAQTDQITFSSSGELENGLKVSVKYQLDQGEAVSSNSPFDDHSLQISSDALGKLVFAGHAAKSASTLIDPTAAGDIWDNFDGIGTGTQGTDLLDAQPGNNAFIYTLPSFVEGLEIFGSYKPTGSTASSATGYGLTYTGIEGLSASYADTAIKTASSTTSGDQKVLTASYAFGPLTVSASDNKFNLGDGTVAATVVGTANTGQDGRSYNVAYSINEAMSVAYGIEEFKSGSTSDEDAKFNEISTAYTTGGITLSASYSQGENIGHGTASNQNLDYYNIATKFNF